MNLIFQLERYSDKIDIFAIFVLHHVACMSYHDDRRVLVTNYSPLSLASYQVGWIYGYSSSASEFSVSTDIFIWFLIWLHLFGVKVFDLSKHLSSQWIGTFNPKYGFFTIFLTRLQHISSMV